MNTTHRTSAWLVLFWALWLPACQMADTPEQPAQFQRESSKPEQPVGKLSAPVDISYEFLSEPRLGQPLEIQISTRPLRRDQTVALELTPGAGLSLASDAMLLPRAVPLTQVRSDRVVVTPMVAGRSFLNVLARVTINGQQMQKAISIPIQVGPVAVSQGEPMRDAQGAPIRSVPAQESTDN